MSHKFVYIHGFMYIYIWYYTTVDPKQWVEKRFEEQVKHIKYQRQESR